MLDDFDFGKLAASEGTDIITATGSDPSAPFFL
jgi:hypothetical protein